MGQFNDSLVSIGNFLQSMRQGLTAFTTQPYTEINSKSGTQYEASFSKLAVAGGASVYIAIVVGAEKMSVKDYKVGFNTERISTQLFKAPSYTGGTQIPVYNMNDSDAVPEDVTIYSDVSVTSEGTAVSTKIVTLGSVGAGNREISSVSDTPGVERILDRNSTYLLKLTNEDNGAGDITGIFTWYQGVLDTPS